MSINHDELGGWTRQASCRALDAELFFPETANDEEAAKRTCSACPVRDACLDHAMTNGEAFGIWGGLNLRERRLLRRSRSAAASPHAARSLHSA